MNRVNKPLDERAMTTFEYTIYILLFLQLLGAEGGAAKSIHPLVSQGRGGVKEKISIQLALSLSLVI